VAEIVAKATSDDVGLRRESTLDVSALPVGATARLTVHGDLPVPLGLLVEGAGFSDEGDRIVRERTLPDLLAPNLRAVMVGINPSVRSADAGFGFAGPGNRFWDAAIAAGLVTSARQPERSLTHESVGFTDLVKRATPRAREITASEFRAGFTRLGLTLRWLRPRVVIVAGLTGWRQATGTAAVAGWQTSDLVGGPVYLMPNPSGLNATTSLDELTDHLRTALDGPPG
jgi:TDG/mug DNA glycosylase family protein